MNITTNLKYISFLALAAALGGFLFGYDAAVISGTISQIARQFSLDEMSQGWYVGCALIGSIGGVAVGGIISDTLGRKKTLLISATLFAVSSIWCATASDFDHLVYARMIGGIGIGVVSIVSPLYISEISVAEYRGRMVSLYQLAVTIGFLGAYIVNFGLLNYSNGGAEALTSPWLSKIFHSEVWRSMLGMAAIPSVLFFMIVMVIPESPRWLILKNEDEKSLSILGRIYGSLNVAKEELLKTKEAIGGETKSNWRELLKPGIMKAVLIGAAIAILGQFMGVNAVLYYGPTIFESSGLSGDDSLFYQVIVGLVNVLTTILAVFIIDKVGRKKLVYFGVTGMIVSLLLIAIYFIAGSEFGIPSVCLLICFLAYIFFCAISISAVIWVLLSEMYPIKIRGLAMSIAGFSLWFGTYLIGQLTPFLLKNATPAGTFILFAFMCLPYMFIIWKYVPETTGKSLEEIEKYWE
ncbi:sugar porter family MFS transporter [Dysgonomonas massiliensis]|mgnify:FL=1|uniref:sugar porter family MFS transporter n=1 Tax=Dysgonomonas massiliensis TaxID=2040292 RepID=UPI000C774793|nr:sugar porter family MFS transporter [Dysgonomonas massiliensis]